MMGRGVILLSLSMIKYSWYIVMKTNFENARPVLSSRALASAAQPEEEEEEDEEVAEREEEEGEHGEETGGGVLP